MPNLLHLPSHDEDGNLAIVVESPRGSKAKLDYDPKEQVFNFGRPLCLGVVYPYDCGFVASTRAEDYANVRTPTALRAAGSHPVPRASLADAQEGIQIAAMNATKAARALGWFSIGLGASELLFGRKLGRTLGLEHRSGLLRIFGLRELAAGLGIFSSSIPRARWLWARVAGDAMDLALLGAAVATPNPRRRSAWLALGNVAAITAFDVLTARQLPA